VDPPPSGEDAAAQETSRGGIGGGGEEEEEVQNLNITRSLRCDWFTLLYMVLKNPNFSRFCKKLFL